MQYIDITIQYGQSDNYMYHGTLFYLGVRVYIYKDGLSAGKYIYIGRAEQFSRAMKVYVLRNKPIHSCTIYIVSLLVVIASKRERSR